MEKFLGHLKALQAIRGGDGLGAMNLFKVQSPRFKVAAQIVYLLPIFQGLVLNFELEP